MQCACAILSSAASRLYNILPRYLIKGTIFGEGEVTEHKTCVLIFTTIFSQTVLILVIIQPNIIINVLRFHIK